MSIVETIAQWGGLAGVVIAVFAIVILYLTRSNIVELLDKDVIMYDKVYELKKNAFQNSFNILDFYEIYGFEVRKSKQFIQKAKVAYNDLMCVATNTRIFDEFFRLTLDVDTKQVTDQDIADFKALCREDLGLPNKKLKQTKDVAPKPVSSSTQSNTNYSSTTTANQPPKQ